MTEAESTKPHRPRRVSHWDRPPPPHDLRWVVGIVGSSLVVLGLLTLGFAGYQLWGTGIETARAQSALEGEFERLLDSSPALSTAGAPSTEPATTVPSTSPPNRTPPGTAPGGSATTETSLPAPVDQGLP
ncbi:MAG: hypothetical protein M3337_07310, partial [Actinomycetota bacterium]|nr:hypothetical protein [Actinomycetota bacterium]